LVALIEQLLYNTFAFTKHMNKNNDDKKLAKKHSKIYKQERNKNEL